MTASNAHHRLLSSLAFFFLTILPGCLWQGGREVSSSASPGDMLSGSKVISPPSGTGTGSSAAFLDPAEEERQRRFRATVQLDLKQLQDEVKSLRGLVLSRREFSPTSARSPTSASPVASPASTASTPGPVADKIEKNDKPYEFRPDPYDYYRCRSLTAGGYFCELVNKPIEEDKKGWEFVRRFGNSWTCDTERSCYERFLYKG